MSKERQYCVIPDDISKKTICDTAAIIVYLFYLNEIEKLKVYFEIVPSEINLYIITPKVEICQYIKQNVRIKAKLHFVIKPNKGRDISALLIASRDIVFNYKYICFLHDKKAISEKLIEDTELWIRNIWENMLASEDYINNIIDYFTRHEECGLLIPPERHGLFFNDWMKSKWGNNYENTKELANVLGLQVDIEYENPSFSLGTAFWCRTEVLKKIMSFEWKYDDFPEEPLDYDGTISHAIERIFPYLTIDSGYCVKTVVSNRYCQFLLGYAQVAAKSFACLDDCLSSLLAFGFKSITILTL